MATNKTKIANKKSTAFNKASLMAVASTFLTPAKLALNELDASVDNDDYICVKKMTAAERTEYFAKMKAVTGNGNNEAFIFAAVDEAGNALFTETDDDIAAVGKLPPLIMDGVINKFNQVNRLILIPESKQAEQDEEDLKNSSAE